MAGQLCDAGIFAYWPSKLLIIYYTPTCTHTFIQQLISCICLLRSQCRYPWYFHIALFIYIYISQTIKYVFKVPLQFLASRHFNILMSCRLYLLYSSISFINFTKKYFLSKLMFYEQNILALYTMKHNWLILVLDKKQLFSQLKQDTRSGECAQSEFCCSIYITKCTYSCLAIHKKGIINILHQV